MPTSGFQVNGGDLGNNLVPKSYLLDRYPELANTFKTAGLWVWGNNSYGQLGDNTRTKRSSPVQTIASGQNWKQVASGYVTAAIKTDGTLWMWGRNNNGQLGVNNNNGDVSSPVQTVSGGTNWKQVSVSDYHVGAIKTDGTLWLWGNAQNGQLGNNVGGVGAFYSSPVQTVAGGSNWKQLSVGGYSSFAVKTDGTLWTWGYNAYGQLGDNSRTQRSSPVQTVAAGTNWKQVSGGYVGVGAVKTDGTLWMWGRNTHGGLGTGNTTNYSSPVQTVAAGTNWKQVSVGSQTAGGGGNRMAFTAAIKTDGTLWCWGRNNYGQLGTNDTTNYSSPVQTIAGGTNWYQVSAGGYAIAAIKTDGTLWNWGKNSYYFTLGTNDATDRSSPTQTIAGGTNWKQVVVSYATFAIRDDSADFGIGEL